MKTILSLIAALLLLVSCDSNTGETSSKDSTTTMTSQTPATAPEATTKPVADAATTNRGMMDAMKAMMPDMMAMKMTGDPDNDFAMMMRSHHQSGVNMAQAYLPGATDAELKSMAQKMIDDQQKEISGLSNFISDHQPARNQPATGNELMKIMHKMPDKGNMPSNPDQHFAAMMIPHHQGGVDMSRAYLKAAKEDKMKSMAESIISKQESEMKQLKDWQARQTQ